MSLHSQKIGAQKFWVFIGSRQLTNLGLVGVVVALLLSRFGGDGGDAKNAVAINGTAPVVVQMQPDTTMRNLVEDLSGRLAERDQQVKDLIAQVALSQRPVIDPAQLAALQPTDDVAPSNSNTTAAVDTTEKVSVDGDHNVIVIGDNNVVTIIKDTTTAVRQDTAAKTESVTIEKREGPTISIEGLASERLAFTGMEFGIPIDNFRLTLRGGGIRTGMYDPSMAFLSLSTDDENIHYRLNHYGGALRQVWSPYIGGKLSADPRNVLGWLPFIPSKKSQKVIQTDEGDK